MKHALVLLVALSGHLSHARNCVTPSYDRIVALYKSGQVLKNVSMESYNCLLSTIATTKGFCTMTLKTEDGKTINALASAEVAGPFDSDGVSVPDSELEVLLIKRGNAQEVAWIHNKQGNELSEKANFCE